MVFANPYYNRYAQVAAGTAYLGLRPSGTSQGVMLNRNNSRTTGGLRKRRRVTRKSSIKTIVRNMHGYKHNIIPDATFTNNMTHNTIYSTNILAKIGQGTSDQQRDGDGIYIAAFKLRGVMKSSSTSGAYQFRVLIGWSGEEYNVSASASGLTSAEIFLPVVPTSWMSTAMVNPKTFTCIYDQTIDINSLIAASSDIVGMNFNVPINQKFMYQQTASVFGKFKNLYAVIIGCVDGGTPGTTACGTFYCNTDTVFQNL